MFFGRDDKKEAQKRGLTVPLLPLRDIIVFPHMVVPLFVGREKSIAYFFDALALYVQEVNDFFLFGGN